MGQEGTVSPRDTQSTSTSTGSSTHCARGAACWGVPTQHPQHHLKNSWLTVIFCRVPLITP